MSEHLLLLSIGPVQELIVQARRMRDLWFGSHVLSEVSKAAALAMTERGATLVFPALDAGDPALQPCNQLHHADGTPAYNVANKLLALVPGDAEAVAEHAEDRARQRLLQWWLDTRDRRSAIVDPAAHDSAEEQLETLLRVDAVWTRWRDDRGDGEDGAMGYAQARTALEAELAARKTLHGFTPWRRQRGGVHKSSLDGGRETVLRQHRPQSGRQARDWRRFRIGEREQLDALGLLKRAGGDPGQFVPVPTIGLAAWSQMARQMARRGQPSALDALIQACKDAKLPEVRRQEAWVQALPFDAQILLPERWAPYLGEHGMSPEVAARFGRAHVEPLLDRMPPPYPYVACLVADGDRMGDAINALAGHGPERHREFSRQLAQFAERARDIVEHDHRGVLVYAGGDDVLAFVCVQDALSCAHALRAAFAAIVREALAEAMPAAIPDTQVKPPTLSVGVGIGHVLQSLGRLLSLGREAEALAKRAHGGQRNRLAVLHERHAGTVRGWHASWDEDPPKRLADAIRLLESQRLTAKKIFQIQDLLERTPAADAAGKDAERWCTLLRAEVQRILARTDPGQTGNETPARPTPPPTPKDVALCLDGSHAELREHISRWVEGMQIAIELLRAQQSVQERA